MIPGHCREVSVKKVGFPLTRENIINEAKGRTAYVNTGYLVLNNGQDWAIVGISKAGGQSLFREIRNVDIIALPADTAYVERPAVDVQNPSVMVMLAEEAGKDALVVKGKFEHVSFVSRETTTPLVVFDVVPPNPPKIVELAEAALNTGRIRKPIRIIPRILDLNELARNRSTPYVMFPCYAAALIGQAAGNDTLYLDQIPELKAPAREITLVGCELSLRIFGSLYAQTPAYMELCPKKLLAGVSEACLCRCCVVDEGHGIEGSTAYVPWGASVGEVEEAIIDLFRLDVDQEIPDEDNPGVDESGVRNRAHAPAE